MAGSVNKVIIVGNVGKDPEMRFLPDGTKVASFSVATSESWKDKSTGERREKTEWHRISIMNDRVADVAEKYVKKGSKVYIEGQLQSRKWTDQSGVERNTVEILIGRFKGEMTLLDNKQGSSSDDFGGHFDDHSGSNQLGGGARNNAASKPAAHNFDDLDDDVPF